MNKRDYLNKLTGLLTEQQLALFNRMYIDGVKQNQITIAVSQCERTLSSLNILDADNKVLKKNIITLERKLDELKLSFSSKEKTFLREIENLKSRELPMDESMINDVAFLRALEEAGVDNWVGYDDAIDIFNENNN